MSFACVDGVKEPRLSGIWEEVVQMRMTLKDVWGDVSTFWDVKNSFLKLSVVESCQLQHDKKNVMKSSGKTSLPFP